MEVHECIEKRRDTRHFTSQIVPKDVLDKALNAAHAAPSVGLTEPWRFIIVESLQAKTKIKELFLTSTDKALELIETEEQRNLYQSLKLEAILDAPIGIAVFCDHSALENFTIGTITNKNTLEWSCVCAIQNLWLSLTAQGYGAGWVSIIDYDQFSAIFNKSQNWKPLGYLCIGKPATDYDGEPMLQNKKWKNRSEKPFIEYF